MTDGKMAELQFLNKVLSTGDASLITSNTITSDYFETLKEEFNFILNHIKTYNCVPDINTFAYQFNDFDVVEVTESTDYLLDKLRQKRTDRKLISSFNTVRDLFNAGKLDEALEEYKRNAEELATYDTITTCTSVFDDKSRFDSYVDKLNNFNNYYVSTGFTELDKALGGGWDRKEELATIVARPNIGKSWILVKSAIASAKQGLKVGVYSGEMSAEKVGFRIDSLVSNISNYGIVHGSAEVSVDYKKYIDSMRTMVKGDILVLTPSEIGHLATVSDLRAFIEKEQLQALFIDQYSLLTDEKRGRSDIERFGNLANDLKNLQVLKQIPIISVSQQNRVSNENGVDLSNIAQSDRIGQNSTTVIFLEQKENESCHNKILTMSLIKSRDSENGKKIDYSADFNKGIFQYIPSSDEDNALGNEGIDELKRDFYEEDDGGDAF